MAAAAAAAALVTKQGYLVKEGGTNVKNWRKRWFVLSNNAIHYMKTPDDSAPLGTIYLEDITMVKRSTEKPSQKFVFELSGVDNSRTWFLSASTAEEMDEWVESIQSTITLGRQSSFKAITLQYAIVECFVNRGVRVSGTGVGPRLLATLTHGIAHDQKKSDEKGWYCDRHLPLCTAINIFVAHGWQLKHVMESVGYVPGEEAVLQPLNQALFYRVPKRLPIESSPSSSPAPTKKLPSLPSAPLPSPPKTPSTIRKQGGMFANDAELQHLMQQMGLNENSSE